MTKASTAGRYVPRDRAWQPEAFAAEYKSSTYRSPKSALIAFPTSLGEETSPVFGHGLIGPQDNNLILNYAAPGEAAIGPRIVVHGRVRDQSGRPVPGALLEFWQANAGGRYRHKKDGYLAPLDPNFGGCGRTITGEDGGYEFLTVQPGPYPWPNRENDWRPAHIHFSVFGHGFAQRLVTQMYFEGDPLIARCPIVGVLKDPAAVAALTAPLVMERAVPMDMLAYRFDIVLRGRHQTPFESQPEGL